MNQRNTKLTTTILWVLAAAYAVALVANIAFQLSIPIALVLLLSVVFALIHGAVRYGWSGIAVFIAVCLVVSNILENTSILTGFPFGHYHYTDLLGPKLFLVPLLIGPAYFANGYFAWVIGNVLIGEVRRGASAFTTFAVPFIASFVMVMWDLTFDPRASTIDHQWIWEQGGGYFGVPFTNYLGWFFTVYLFLQLFALFIRFRPGGNDTARTWPRSHYVQAIVMYAAIGLTPVLTFLVGGSNSPIADAAGAVWQTRSIAESVATVSLYTMIFAVVLSTMKLFQPSEG
ncbi:MAG TPA: carotenoid biosynthesis protein [Candidatus Eisenbacteria bacterium]|nr:carotenoid biosynthesis protein [Candidatus Eisenbacteria bacterium]